MRPPRPTLFPYTTLFRSCAVVITHDRWFLDRVATHILAFEGDSVVTWFEGGWGEYAEWVKETRGPEALRSEEHTSELQSQSNLVCRLLLEKKNISIINIK